MTAVTAYLVSMDIKGGLTGAGVALGIVVAAWGGAALANAEPDTAPVVVEAPVEVVKVAPPEPVVIPEPAPVVVPEVVVPEPVVEQPAPEPVAPEPPAEPEPIVAPEPAETAEPYVAPGAPDEGAPYGRTHTGLPMPAPATDGNTSESYTSEG